jgi:DNA-binding CsgD family transcriptional regulator
VLSGIERSIMCHISNGATARETADALHISHRTVENHKRRIFTRLGAATQAQAVALAIRAGELTALERAS